MNNDVFTNLMPTLESPAMREAVTESMNGEVTYWGKFLFVVSSNNGMDAIVIRLTYTPYGTDYDVNLEVVKIFKGETAHTDAQRMAIDLEVGRW